MTLYSYLYPKLDYTHAITIQHVYIFLKGIIYSTISQHPFFGEP